ncbi:hypothetical protein E0K83_00600 [Gramella sp. BOM4]|nr:hypothetical protein [Christiangramia bathymodioli]
MWFFYVQAEFASRSIPYNFIYYNFMRTIRNFLLKSRLSFHFYRKMLVVMAILAALISMMGTPFVAVMLIKIVLIGLLLLSYEYVEKSDNLVFYKNFGITPIFLFVFCVFTDGILSLIIFKTVRGLI